MGAEFDAVLYGGLSADLLPSASLVSSASSPSPAAAMAGCDARLMYVLKVSHFLDTNDGSCPLFEVTDFDGFLEDIGS